MFSLFNPYVLAGIFALLVASFFEGHHIAYVEQQAEIAKLNEQARQTEQEASQKVTDLSTQLVKANQNAKLQIQKRDADIASGKLRLSIALSSVPASSNAASAGGDSVQARAELDPTTAQSLVSITDQGDANTRQLNACIDAYNTVFKVINGGKK
jgi:prophage endopeptidase